MIKRATYPHRSEPPAWLGFPFISRWEGADSRGLPSWHHHVMTKLENLCEPHFSQA